MLMLVQRMQGRGFQWGRRGQCGNADSDGIFANEIKLVTKTYARTYEVLHGRVAVLGGLVFWARVPQNEHKSYLQWAYNVDITELCVM